MSFSSSAKDELTKLRLRGERRRTLLCAAVGAIGGITLSRGGMGVRCVTENMSVGRLIAQLAASEYDLDAAISVNQHQRLNARTVTVALTGDSCRQLLKDSGVMAEDGSLSLGGGPPAALTDGEDAARVYLRGVFMACGSVSNPRKGYHLEMVCRTETSAGALLSLMQIYDLGGKSVTRNGSYVVYIKGSERIAAFLAFVGASEAIMELENTLVIKEVRNRVNRVSNCEVGNLGKTAEAAARQAAAIESIRASRGLGSLPPALYSMAELRINNPVASLSELAELSGLSRSVINRRLNKLEELSKEV